MESQTITESRKETPKHFLRGLPEDLTQAIHLTMNCHQLCHQMVLHCVAKGGIHCDTRHIRLLDDCAQICATTSDFLIRESHFHVQISDLCSDICEACAQDCERLARDDSMMQVCADVCAQTARSCRDLISD